MALSYLTGSMGHYLSLLPRGYKERSLRNAHKESLTNKMSGLAHSIINAFDWENSPEGYAFWSKLHSWSQDATFGLPKLPDNTVYKEQ